MAEDTPQAQLAPDSDVPAAPMPSAEPNPSEQPAPEVSTPEQEAQLPADVRERTKREFDKLRTQLSEERARREYVESVYTQQAQQPQEGYTDPVAQTAQQALEESARTKQQFQTYLHEQEDREAYAAHPELNPNDTNAFDRDLHVAVRRIYLDSMLNPQDYNGKQLSLKEAGDIAKSARGPAIEQARKAGAQEALQQLSPKEQAALQASGNPNGQAYAARTSLEELRVRSRKGDLDAISQRLKGLSSVGGD